MRYTIVGNIGTECIIVEVTDLGNYKSYMNELIEFTWKIIYSYYIERIYFQRTLYLMCIKLTEV